MYGGNTTTTSRTPFAPSVATADLHHNGPVAPSQRTALPTYPHHYPSTNAYNIPSSGGGGHHHHPPSGISAALARQYAAAMAPLPPIGVAMEMVHHHGRGAGGFVDRDYTAPIENEDYSSTGARRRCNGSNSRKSSASTVQAQMAAGGQPPTGAGGKKQRFEILRKLGSGTYGKVSLAMDHKAGEEVAIKVIRKSAIENTSDLIRIRREIRIMSGLKHPNIIEIKEVFENAEKIIIVMENASGGELYDFVGKHGPLPEEEVRRLFRQIVSAVYYCHMHGVAHRDLKLENILLDKNMGAKIADFGLSNYFTDHSLLRTFCGSPLYASPEIINGTPYKGPEADCWSLGVLLYTLAYSSMPFDGRDFNRMARQIKRGAYYEPDPPSSASMLIRSMLRVNPERRGTISEIAAHWWLNFDETGSSIADLPENQVLDATPLYVRQETMMIQSFGEENEMFAEFTHLSDATRKKIEEFRRRRREAADWYLVECQTPLKKHSKKRSSSIVNEQQQQQQRQQSGQTIPAGGGGQKRSRESSVAAASGVDMAHQQRSDASASEVNSRKNSAAASGGKTPAGHYTAAEIAAGQAGGLPDEELLDNLTDPLNRLKALESRLQYREMMKDNRSPTKHLSKMDEIVAGEEPAPVMRKVSDEAAGESGGRRPSSLSLEKRSQKFVESASPSALSTPKKQKPTMLKMSVDDLVHEKRALDQAVDNATAASLTSAVMEDANRMVNQLLEEALKGNVSADLVEKIRSSDAYSTEAFVKEILESVLAAHQSKSSGAGAVVPPSTPTSRASRSKSKLSSSVIRVPKSGSGTPLPDVIIRTNNEGGENSAALLKEGSTPPPDVVAAVAAIGDALPSTLVKASTPPVATATVTLVPKKVIYESVPEDSELQLAVDQTGAAVSPTASEQEEEEDICSTDFEDLGSEEDFEGGNKGSKESALLTGEASFPSAHSQPLGDAGELLPALAAEAAASTAGDGASAASTASAEGGENEENPFLRGLSKRLSRGKYERSKFTFTKGVSIDEPSPRSSKRCAETEAEEANKQTTGQGTIMSERNEAELQQSTNGRKSPMTMRRRHSDGDKNHNLLLQPPLAESGSWSKKSDSDLGSSQDVRNISPVVNSGGEIITESAAVHTVMVDSVVAEETEKFGDEGDMPNAILETAALPSDQPAAQVSPGSKKPKVKKVIRAKDAPAADEVKPAKSSELPTEAIESKETRKSKKTGKKIVRRKSCATNQGSSGEMDNNTAATATNGDNNEDGATRRASTTELLKSTKEEDANKEKLVVDEDHPATGAANAGGDSNTSTRRDSYPTSLGAGRDSIGSADYTSPSAAIGPARSSKYQQLASGGVAVADPLWLQYAREETQRAKQHALASGHGLVEYKSPFGYGGYDRGDDDYHHSSSGGTRSHVPQQSLSYRSGGGTTYSARDRDLSPSRFLSSTTGPPVIRSQVDPFDAAATAYHDNHHSSFGPTTGRGRRPSRSSLYQQGTMSSVDGGGEYLADGSTGSSGNRYNPNSSALVTGYGPAYTRRTTGSGDYYRPLYDDNLVYRRASHYETPPSPPEDDYVGGKGQFRVFQPKGLMKRRSRSLDKMNSRLALQPDADEPDSPTYGTTAANSPPYHHYQPNITDRYDSSASTTARQPPTDAYSSRAHLRSILKKQPPTFDNSSIASRYGDTTATADARKTSEVDAAAVASRPGASLNFVDRLLRRHEKPPAAAAGAEPPVDYAPTSYRPHRYNETSSAYSREANANDTIGELDAANLDPKYGGSKKRNYMSSARRRTAEIRYGGVDLGGDDYGLTTKRQPTSAATGASRGTADPSGFHYSAAASPFATYQSTSNPVNSATPVASAIGTTNNYTSGGGVGGYRKLYQTPAHRVTSYIPSSRYHYEDP